MKQKSKVNNESTVSIISFDELTLDEQVEAVLGKKNLKDIVVEQGVPYSAESIVDKIEHYRLLAKRLLWLTLLSMSSVVVLAIIIGYISLRPPITLTYSIDEVGNIVQLEEIDKPGLSEASLLEWAARRAQDIHHLSFHDWDDHIDEMSKYFTPEGHRNYQLALKSSDLHKRVTEGGLVSWATPSKAPRLSDSGVVNGVYTWQVELYFNVYIGGGGDNTVPAAIKSTMIIKRTEKATNNFGILIAQYLSSEAK